MCSFVCTDSDRVLGAALAQSAAGQIGNLIMKAVDSGLADDGSWLMMGVGVSGFRDLRLALRARLLRYT